jgi:histidinol-phosphatase (PHP family)
MYDFHVRSLYSAGCRYDIEKMAVAAIKKKIKLIYAADYYEINEKKDWDMSFDLNEYRNEIQRINKKYDEVEILSAIELGIDESEYGRFNDLIDNSQLDMIILSTHKVNGVYLSDERFYSEKHTLEIYQEYYTEILETIRKFDNFDVVGHLDLIDRFKERYYIDLEFGKYKKIISDILKEIIGKDKSLEINTSGYHSIVKRPYPKKEILTMYKKLGGEKIVIGSDANKPDLIGYKHKELISDLKDIGLNHITVYRKRIPHMVRF